MSRAEGGAGEDRAQRGGGIKQLRGVRGKAHLGSEEAVVMAWHYKILRQNTRLGVDMVKPGVVRGGGAPQYYIVCPSPSLTSTLDWDFLDLDWTGSRTWDFGSTIIL